MPDRQSYASLAELCLDYGIQLLINPYSIKRAPVTTMRMYDTSLVEFNTKHEAFLRRLTEMGHPVYKVHMEHGVFDTNVFTDMGWLFLGSDYKTPITTVDCAHRLEIPVIH